MATSVEKILADAKPLAELGRATQDLADKLSHVRRVGIDMTEPATIVALGSKSAGCSTLLRSLCGFPFPETSSGCSSFLVILALVPAGTRAVDVRAICNEGSQAFAVGDEAPLAKRYEEAALYLRGKTGANLRVTLYGPGFPEIRVFDLPTIELWSPVRARAPPGSFEATIAAVLQNPNYTILAVVDACQPSQWEETMALLRPLDVARRTLGVIMKADCLLSSLQSFSATIKLVQNERHNFILPRGWFVLSRAGGAGEDMDDAETKFFASANWQLISGHQKGISALRDKLSGLLFDTLRRRLPALSTTIGAELERKRGNLRAIGKSLPDDEAKRRDLLQLLGGKYRTIAEDAQIGSYRDAFFAPQQLHGPPRQKHALHNRFNEITAAFRTVMEQYGAFWFIEGSPGPCTGPAALDGSNLVGSFDTTPPVAITLDTLHQWFPDSSHEDLASCLFRRQSDKWSRIASKYLELVHAAAADFVKEAIGYTFGSYPSLKENVNSEFVLPSLQAIKGELGDECKELMEPFRDESMAHADQCEYYFTNQYIAERVKALIDTQPCHSSDDVYQAVLCAIPPIWPAPHFRIAVDTMTEHYDRSLEMFVEHVVGLGRENCLARLPTLLDRLTSPDLDLTTLHRLAQEPDATKQARELAQERIRVLDGALNVCQSNSINV